MEPIARAHYELMHDIDMPPALLEHYELPWLRASMDGWNKEQKIGLEIKCPGAKNHALAAEGKIPEEYYPQIQHQLFVSGAERIDYFSFDGKNGVTVPVFPNLAYILDYIIKARQFWHLVETDEEPELTIKDWKSLRNKDLRIALEDWEQSDIKNNDEAKNLLTLIFARDDVFGRRIRCSKFFVDGINRTIRKENYV